MKKPTGKPFFLENEKYNIQYGALNALVAEIILRKGDPEGKVAEYFLGTGWDLDKYHLDEEIIIWTPNFLDDGEELIEGVDIISFLSRPLYNRDNPWGALNIVRYIEKALNKRKVPKERIDEIKKQFLKDCFKIAYIGMFDKNIHNWGIKYKGKEMAQIAPLYDLDWSLNAPINYRYLGIFPEEDQNRIKRFCEGQVLQQYMRVFGEQFDWFNDFAKEFARNVQSIDLRQELQEQKGITTVHEEQLQHYQAFIQQQNNIIQKALETRSDGANTCRVTGKLER